MLTYLGAVIALCGFAICLYGATAKMRALHALVLYAVFSIVVLALPLVWTAFVVVFGTIAGVAAIFVWTLARAMSNVRGVIPKVVVFAIGFILIYAFGMPTPTQIGTRVFEAIYETFPSYTHLWFILILRISGWLLMIEYIIAVYIQRRRREDLSTR